MMNERCQGLLTHAGLRNVKRVLLLIQTRIPYKEKSTLCETHVT